jgi:hypothetical protein
MPRECFPRLAVLTLALVLAGCDPFISFSRISFNAPLTDQDTAFLKPNTATLAQVVEQLGAPNEIRGADGGAVAVYYFLRGKRTRVNYLAPAQVVQAFIPDVVVNVGGIGVDQLTIWFDERWIVRDHGFAFNKKIDQFRLVPARQAQE